MGKILHAILPIVLITLNVTLILIPMSNALSSSFKITDYEFHGYDYIHGGLNNNDGISYES